MGTDYLDLWQIHDVRTEEDFQTIAGPGGALEAFTQAKASGKIRFIGLTGHHDPEILTRAVKAWPIDSLLIPVNPIEGNLGGFLTSTIAAARAKGVTVIGMKVLGGSNYLIPLDLENSRVAYSIRPFPAHHPGHCRLLHAGRGKNPGPDRTSF